MTKDLYIEAHEELIAEYIDKHPNVSWHEAYDLLTDKAYARYVDNYADLIDRIRQRVKDSL